MALTQAQKNFISLISTEPEEAFDKIKQNKINLNEFKNSYLRTGIGLMHVLVNGFIHSPDVYLPIINYVIDNSNLKLTDRPSNGNTPLDLFKSSHGTFFNKNFILTDSADSKYMINYMKLIHLVKDKDESLIKNTLDLLYSYNLKEEFTNFYKNNITSQDYNSNGLNNLTKKIILNDDVDNLKLISNDFKYFNINNRYYNLEDKESLNIEEKSNVLISCIKGKLNNVFDYLIEETNINLDGKVLEQNSEHLYINTNPYSDQKKKVYTHVAGLTQSVISDNEDFFIKILNKTSDFDLIKILLSKLGYNSNNQDSLLSLLLQKEHTKYLNILLPRIPEMIKNEDKEKRINYNEKSFYTKFVNTILHSQDLEKIPLLLEQIIPYNTPEETEIIGNSFFSNIYNRKDLLPEDYTHIETILNVLNKYNHLYADYHHVYKPKFFTDENIYNIISKFDFSNDNYSKYNNDLPFNLINFYLSYLKQNSKQSMSDFFKNTQNQSSVENFINQIKDIENQEKNILTDIMNKLGSQVYIDNPNILSQIIGKNHSILFSLIPDSQILNLANKDENAVKQDFNNKLYPELINVLNSLNYDFFKPAQSENEKMAFHYVMSNNCPVDLIDNILTRQNKSISELSLKSIFFKSIHSEELSEYVSKNGANYSNPETLSELIYGSDYTLELYLKNNCDTSYRNQDGGNIIHKLVDIKFYKTANLILDYYPHLASEINNQQKFPISYMLKEFDKLCANPPRFMGVDDFKEMHTFVKLSLVEGLESNKKKSISFLKQQFDKYYNIHSFDETLSNLLTYGRLEKMIPKTDINKTVVKKNKI